MAKPATEGNQNTNLFFERKRYFVSFVLVFVNFVKKEVRISWSTAN